VRRRSQSHKSSAGSESHLLHTTCMVHHVEAKIKKKNKWINKKNNRTQKLTCSWPRQGPSKYIPYTGSEW
jgi:hypothetical protein